MVRRVRVMAAEEPAVVATAIPEARLLVGPPTLRRGVLVAGGFRSGGTGFQSFECHAVFFPKLKHLFLSLGEARTTTGLVLLHLWGIHLGKLPIG